MLSDTRPQVIVALLAMGMALAFVLADRKSPTSRALALFLACVGLSIGIGSQVAYPLHAREGPQWWSGLFAIPETLAFVFAYEWILRVRRTVPARNLKTRFGDRQLRVAQALALVRGGDFVTPDHVRDMAVPVLAHRLVLDPQAKFSGATAQQVVADVLRAVPVPA